MNFIQRLFRRQEPASIVNIDMRGIVIAKPGDAVVLRTQRPLTVSQRIQANALLERCEKAMPGVKFLLVEEPFEVTIVRASAEIEGRASA